VSLVRPMRTRCARIASKSAAAAAMPGNRTNSSGTTWVRLWNSRPPMNEKGESQVPSASPGRSMARPRNIKTNRVFRSGFTQTNQSATAPRIGRSAATTLPLPITVANAVRNPPRRTRSAIFPTASERDAGGVGGGGAQVALAVVLTVRESRSWSAGLQPGEPTCTAHHTMQAANQVLGRLAAPQTESILRRALFRRLLSDKLNPLISAEVRVPLGVSWALFAASDGGSVRGMPPALHRRTMFSRALRVSRSASCGVAR